MHPSFRRSLRAALAATAAASLAGSAIFTAVAFAAPAASSAATAAAGPPWGKDPNSVGSLIFYNSAGKVVTSGGIKDRPIAAYVQGSNTIRSGDTKATLFGYLPVQGQTPGEWSGDELSLSTPYPNKSAPGTLKSSALPLVTGHSPDEDLQILEGDFPNNAPSSSPYYGLYQLRLRTSTNDEGLTITYDSATIKITGDSWAVVFAQVKTATTFSVSPASSAYHGATVKLSATVSPKAAAGSVEFRDGSKTLKTVAVKSGAATYSTTTLPDGVNKLSAVFVPTDSGAYSSSTSVTHSLKVIAHPTTTSLKASKTTIKKGQKVTLTAKETPAVAGSIAFYDGKKKLATVKVSKGGATYSTTKLSVGTHSLKAVFTPSVLANDAASSSAIVKIRVTA
jgi:hypothetical protein